MPIVASESVQQDEIRERMKRFRLLFVGDQDVARIDHHFSQDWSGDDSIFVEVVLSSSAPPSAVITRLTGQIDDALLHVVGGEELGLHAYLNFLSRPANSR